MTFLLLCSKAAVFTQFSWEEFFFTPKLAAY